MSDVTATQPVRPSIPVTPPRVVVYGASTQEQRDAWGLSEYNGDRDARRQADEAASIAFGYAWGWLDALRAAGRLSEEDDARLMEAVLPFGREYAHDRWLYVTEQQGSLPPYARSWETFLRSRELGHLLSK